MHFDWRAECFIMLSTGAHFAPPHTRESDMIIVAHIICEHTRDEIAWGAFSNAQDALDWARHETTEYAATYYTFTFLD
jgi:hypothetical protein